MSDENARASTSFQPEHEMQSPSDEDLRRFGITKPEQTVYEWNGYRYSNASNAIDAAKRAGR